MFEADRERAGGRRELAELNDVMRTTRAVDPPAPCTLHAHTMIPYATVGWGGSCPMFVRANGIDGDADLDALLLDEGVTNQGLHLGRVSTTLVNTKREPVWDVIVPIQFTALKGLPDGYEPLV